MGQQTMQREKKESEIRIPFSTRPGDIAGTSERTPIVRSIDQPDQRARRTSRHCGRRRRTGCGSRSGPGPGLDLLGGEEIININIATVTVTVTVTTTAAAAAAITRLHDDAALVEIIESLDTILELEVAGVAARDGGRALAGVEVEEPVRRPVYEEARRWLLLLLLVLLVGEVV